MLVLALSVMIVMSFSQVVLRDVFGTSIEWGDILLRHLVLWLGFLGATIATGENRHIKVDFLTKLLPSRLQKPFAVATSLFAAYICILLLYASVIFIQDGLTPGSTLIFNLPTAWFVIIIPVGYGLMAFRFIVLVVGWIVEMVHGNWMMKASV
jgi:TRAP-type C4-dicarboxylate transport system permease small subunit